MATQMVRIGKRAHDTLRELAELEHEPMSEILARAIEEYRRKRFFDDLDASFARLASAGGHPDGEDQCGGTLMDGLDDDEVWDESGAATHRG